MKKSSFPHWEEKSDTPDYIRNSPVGNPSRRPNSSITSKSKSGPGEGVSTSCGDHVNRSDDRGHSMMNSTSLEWADGSTICGPLRFESGDGTKPVLSPSPSRRPWSSKNPSSTAGSPAPSNRASTTSGVGERASRRDGGRGRVLAAARAEIAQTEAEARQALAMTQPNLFPEIVVAVRGRERGSGGVVGWQGERSVQ